MEKKKEKCTSTFDLDLGFPLTAALVDEKSYRIDCMCKFDEHYIVHSVHIHNVSLMQEFNVMLIEMRLFVIQVSGASTYFVTMTGSTGDSL